MSEMRLNLICWDNRGGVDVEGMREGSPHIFLNI